jgi:hypothetical protein
MALPDLNSKTLYTAEQPSFQDSPQVRSTIWEAFSVPIATPCDPAAMDPVERRGQYYLIGLELSELSRPMYLLVIDRLKAAVVDRGSGHFSVFVVKSGIHFPLINRGSMKFSLITVPDIEDLCIPPLQSIFFDLQNDTELFLEYLNFLRWLSAGVILGSYTRLIQVLNSIRIGYKIPVVVLTSLLAVDDVDVMRAFVSEQVFKPTTHFDIFVIQPPVCPPDYGALSD